MNFPKKIFVNWQRTRTDDPFLDVTTKVEFIDEFVNQVAIYELKEVKRLKVTRELK